MEKGKSILSYLLFGFSFVVFLLSACEPEIDDGNNQDDNTVNKNFGNITFNFPIPDRSVPPEKVHRINLSIAQDAHSLFSGYFLESANVSDLLRSYSFKLEEGEYFYQAGITCSCRGRYLPLGWLFPGGQWGTKWSSGKVEVKKGEMLFKNLTFNN